MRNSRNRRSGFDRALAAVAATVLTVGTASLVQADPAKTPAELAIDAAVPVPEPANVPPPTAADFKPVAPAASEAPKAAETAKPADAPKAADAAKPADAPKAAEAKPDTATPPAATATAPAAAPETKQDTATAPAAAPAATPSAAATPTDATASIAAADQPFADKLRDLLSTKTAKYFDRKAERAAVETFYKDRNYAPLWTSGNAASAQAKGAIATMKNAAAEGLDPADYPVPDFAAATTPEAQADAELKLTASILDYARHAQSGRMHWSQVSGDILYPDHYPEPAEVLTKVSTAKDATAALDSYNPPIHDYQALKKKLAELRGVTDDTSKRIEDGPTLRYVKPRRGQDADVMEDPRVPLLRARLGITENSDDTHYDATVEAAVRKFQAQNGLRADGIVGDGTIRALNGERKDSKIDIVRVNMERLRWLPRDPGAKALGDAYVMLNIPDYTLKVMHNGKQVWKTRVVVGKAGKHATPLLTETMKYITVNPTWNVPPSIIYNEYLPALEQDPTVLDRMGLKMSRNADGSIRISQPPGEANALGRIRFNFPNKFLVYQHDTPDKNLFAKETRAYSHGCMRVQNPDQYAATLLGIALPKENYTPEKIRSMYGRGEININLPTPIPVNIVYQTAFVDDAGKLEFRKDIYGRDARMISLLNGSGKNLEAVVAHSQPTYSRPTNVRIPGESYASNSGPQNFFEMLFGGGRPMMREEPIRPRRRIYH
ncbi:L,D-transpeptidase family protein [Afipia sp. TerB]